MQLIDPIGKNSMPRNIPDSEAVVQSAIGIYFGSTTAFGLIGWAVLQGQESKATNWLWSVLGIILFAMLTVLEKRLRPKVRTSLNYTGYLFTIVAIVYLGYRMWASV